MSGKRTKMYTRMTKNNFRIVIISVEKEREERRNGLVYFL